MSVYVTIGRNVGDEPMSDDQWEAFRLSTYQVVENLAGDVVTSAEGIGRYEGQTEATYVVVADGSRIADTADLGRVGDGWWEARTRDLYAALGALGAQYGQESIAVTIAEPEFVVGKVFADGS